MDDEVDTLVNVLLSPSEENQTRRHDAAEKLSSYFLNIRAFNALYSICCYPDMSAMKTGLLQIAGQSIGKIISIRDRNEDPMKHHSLAPKYFDSFHPEALEAALSVLTSGQVAKVCEYTLSHPLCSDTLVFYFLREASKQAMLMYETNPRRAALQAAKASLLFKRVNKEMPTTFAHFKDIVMHIIANNPAMTIFPLFLDLLKKEQNFASPKTEFDKYTHSHLILIAKLACSDYRNFLFTLNQLREWVTFNRPEDAIYINVLELITQANLQGAFHLCKKIRGSLRPQEEETELTDFYHVWYLAVRWLITKRLHKTI